MCHQQISAEILVAIASVIAEEAVLTANKVKVWINLRETPSEIGKYLGYGLVGDRVQIIAQATGDNYIWYEVRFPRSGAQGWIRGDFVSQP